MLKTLDILIGTTTILLVFALAVTVLTQAMTTMLSRKGDHLRDGLASLLRQLGMPKLGLAQEIAGAVLQHPMISEGTNFRGKVRLGTVIHREEFTKILLAAAAGVAAEASSPAAGSPAAINTAALWCDLSKDAKEALIAMLKANGVPDPAGTLKNVRDVTLQLEASNPELASNVRQSIALLREASSDYLGVVNGWFDQTIDRVSQRFAKNTHAVTVALAVAVVMTVQLDIIAVLNRLSVDDKLRNQIVQTAAADPSMQGTKPQARATSTAAADPTLPDFRGKTYYDALTDAGLLTMPSISPTAWWNGFNLRKIPGMIVGILLISLGAPLWYNVLKDLLGLRSTLAKSDDLQRAVRQTTQEVVGVTVTSATGGQVAP